MRKVEAAAEQTAHVPPEVVWSLLSDVMVYPQWGPWRKAGYRSEGDAAANGKGAVYWLEGSKRYGFRYPVSVEEILDVEPGKRLAYTVLRGIPVRNYRAEVTPDPVTRRHPHPLGGIVGPDHPGPPGVPAAA
jgi:uncharacterized protein YndB with AHSA1/START domain